MSLPLWIGLWLQRLGRLWMCLLSYQSIRLASQSLYLLQYQLASNVAMQLIWKNELTILASLHTYRQSNMNYAIQTSSPTLFWMELGLIIHYLPKTIWNLISFLYGYLLTVLSSNRLNLFGGQSNLKSVSDLLITKNRITQSLSFEQWYTMLVKLSQLSIVVTWFEQIMSISAKSSMKCMS